MKAYRRLSSIRVTALLLLLLGIGNVVVGHTKGTYYSEAVIQAQREAISQELPLGSPGVQRLISRKRFYEIVSLGGYLFIATAAVLFMAGLSRKNGRR